MQLKRWESPRREGRNDKGKGGSARKRQLKKQQQMLRKKLKKGDSPDKNKNQRQGEENLIFPLFFLEIPDFFKKSYHFTKILIQLAPPAPEASPQVQTLK